MSRVFHWIIAHALFIACCAASLVFQTAQLLHFPFNFYLGAFVFFSTLCGYNFHWFIGSLGLQKNFSFSIITNHATTLFFLCCGFAGLCFVFPKSNISSTDAVLSFALTFIYSIPLLPIKQLAFTRKAGFLKTILLAFTWMFVTAYIPIQQAGIGFGAASIWWMIRRFLFMLMLCIIFDNRDIASDKIKGLHSLATDLHPAVMKWLIYFIFLLLFASNFLYNINGITVPQSVALQVAATATVIVYFFSKKKQGYFFYYFLVDGLMLLSALLTTVASI